MAKLTRLEASTLIEVLIAMVIIMVVFTLGIQIFNNVLYSSPSPKKIQAQQQLDAFAKDVKRLGYIEEPEVMVDSILYRFSIDSNDTPGLKHLEIKAAQQDIQLGQIHVLYQSKPHEE